MDALDNGLFLGLSCLILPLSNLLVWRQGPPQPLSAALEAREISPPQPGQLSSPDLHLRRLVNLIYRIPWPTRFNRRVIPVPTNVCRITLQDQVNLSFSLGRLAARLYAR